MNPSPRESRFRRAAALADLDAHDRLSVTVGDRVVLLVRHEGRVHALDNRCPHMGFPLERGDVSRGLLTCPWHHARFELCSGGTLDPFADDVRTFPVEIRDDAVWVDPEPHRDERAHAKRRLREGLEQQLSLVMAKAAIALDALDADPAELLAIAGVFGARQRAAGWRDGLTILTAMGNLLDRLGPEQRPLALYHGLLHVAANVAGARPHYPLEALPGSNGAAPGEARLSAWLREFTEVRDRDGMERIVATALQDDLPAPALARMLHAAATDRLYLDGGHSVDFVNKGFELLDAIGWHHAAAILPSLLAPIAFAQRMEEAPAWRNPVDLPAVLAPVLTRLAESPPEREPDEGDPLPDAVFDALVATLLGDDPAAIATALETALVEHRAPVREPALALCAATATRVARFHTSNEFGDWIAVLHSLSSAHATLRLLERAPSWLGARGIWHSAMHLYLNRFLNAPAARPPSETTLAGLPEAAAELEARLLELTEARGNVEQAAAVVARHRTLGHDPAGLERALAATLLREDGEFHSYQMLEAGLRLHRDLARERPAHAGEALRATARYLAAHAPTDRATTQTWRIAVRLHAGEALAAE